MSLDIFSVDQFVRKLKRISTLIVYRFGYSVSVHFHAILRLHPNDANDTPAPAQCVCACVLERACVRVRVLDGRTFARCYWFFLTAVSTERKWMDGF